MRAPPRFLLLSCLALLTCGGSAACGGSGASADATGGGSSTSDATSSESGASETETGTDGETETETGTDTEDTGDPPGNLLLSDRQLNIAHRGGGRLRPEATLPAFEHALAIGADVIEFDLHASADGAVVVIHDDTVDRTTDGTGMVAAMTLAELQALDAGYQFTPDGGATFPYRGMGIQIPTLDAVLDAFPDEYYLIEIKQSEPSIVPQVLASLDAHGVGDRVVLASFQQVTIDEVRATAPDRFTALSFDEMVDFYAAIDDPGYVPPAVFLQAPWEVVDAELVGFAHSLGMIVHPWTANSEALMHDLIDLGVDGIMTDDPELLAAALGG